MKLQPKPKKKESEEDEGKKRKDELEALEERIRAQMKELKDLKKDCRILTAQNRLRHGDHRGVIQQQQHQHHRHVETLQAQTTKPPVGANEKRRNDNKSQIGRTMDCFFLTIYHS